MKKKLQLSIAEKITVTGLLIATAGVIIQIIAGAHYPKIPVVFFMLLIPACLIAFGRWRWAPIIAVFTCLFLIFGFFKSDSLSRMLSINKFGDATGLWIQMLAVIVSSISSIIATIGKYKGKLQ